MTEEISIVEDKEYLRITIDVIPDSFWEIFLGCRRYTREFIGSSTCWYYWPSFTAAGTENCSKLHGIWKKWEYDKSRKGESNGPRP